MSSRAIGSDVILNLLSARHARDVAVAGKRPSQKPTEAAES